MKYTNDSSSEYYYVLPFERKDFVERAATYMEARWMYSFYFSAVYLVLIFGGKYVMKNKQRFELRKPLALWSTILAIFSLMGATRTIPEFWNSFGKHGLYNSVCNCSYILEDHVTAFWALAFALSKLPELGDTIFIILRKQPLIFLHWYHHVTVLLYTWFNIVSHPAMGRWFMVMNYCVHTVMYTYYALRAIGYRPWSRIPILITSLQILQMVIGFAISIWVFILLNMGVKCHVSKTNVTIGLMIYSTYFVLFARFFYANYIQKAKQNVTKVSTKEEQKLD